MYFINIIKYSKVKSKITICCDFSKKFKQETIKISNINIINFSVNITIKCIIKNSMLIIGKYSFFFANLKYYNLNC